MNAWVQMWLVAFVIFAGCKALTWRSFPRNEVSLLRKIAYSFFWPGMDIGTFLSKSPRLAPPLIEWLFAISKMLLGLWLFLLVAPSSGHLPPYAQGWIAMVGLVFILHFGLFHVLSCFWRSWGIEAVALMQAPYAARDLSDFWGKRWNLAFRDLTHRFLFRPLSKKIPPLQSLFLVFVGSGLVHDLVITVPSGSGYGGPTLYFFLQALGMTVERTRFFRANPIRRRVLCWLILVAPVPLLFPPAFVNRIILPMMQDFHEGLTVLLGF